MENQVQKTIAILLTEGFEQVEMTEPRKALEAEGFQTDLITPEGGDVKAWNETDWGDIFKAHKALNEASPNDYDALLLPGGVMNPDQLRMDKNAVAFVEAFFESDKPVAAICHAPMMLIEADVVEGRKVTSYPSLQTDLRNAGAEWVDEEVVVDGNLVTSRTPDDIPAFNQELIKLIKEGVHVGQQV
ncbi:type 1 glutamine amidotransferase domain-containing protein [Spirosoma soli]|uniref:Type 1 glutamine amidotransferase domain-containing protein n=1 Tax=Spirosoma soli TaxID=1770529 RepID=A0ABW5LZX9_9BACT